MSQDKRNHVEGAALEDITVEVQPELKPCPFCGDDGEMVDAFPTMGWYAQCSNATCGARRRHYFPSKDMKQAAIDEWNTRANTDTDSKGEPRIYPCVECGTMRSKGEGGTTFTVCDECWDRKHKPNPDTVAVVNKLQDFIESQTSMPEELSAFVDKHFWDLV